MGSFNLDAPAIELTPDDIVECELADVIHDFMTTQRGGCPAEFCVDLAVHLLDAGYRSDQ